MNQNSFSNPFVECTARDMDYREVLKYWCSPFNLYNGLDEKILFSHPTPLLLEGARGCGKTMILKYLSFFCQIEDINFSDKSVVIEHFNNRGIGVYFRFTNDFGKVLMTIESENKNVLFEHYFYLYYIREIIAIFIKLKDCSVLSIEDEQTILQKITQKYGEFQGTSFGELTNFVNLQISNSDSLIRKRRYLKDIQDAISNFSDSKLLFDLLLSAFRQTAIAFKDVKFLILLDEYENIKDFHIIVNTLLRQTDASNKLSYRISVRPESISTYKTLLSGEPIQADRDYILIPLENGDPKRYRRFLKEIAKKRLDCEKFFKENNLTDIDELLGAKEDWEEEARSIAKSDLDKSFELLDAKIIADEIIKTTTLKNYNKSLSDFLDGADSTAKNGLVNFFDSPNIKMIAAKIENIKMLLKNHDNPLLQLMNVIWFNRGKSAEEISQAMKTFSKEHKNSLHKIDQIAYKYMLDYNMKYKYQLLFILISLYKGASKKYYSFTTFSYLASGSVNDFITLCRNTFSQLNNDDRRTALIQNREISDDCQNNGAQEAAKELLDKFRICEDNGQEMYFFVLNLGQVFSHHHEQPLAMKYPETNQFAFLDEADLCSRDFYATFKNMLKWGVVERKSSLQRLSFSMNKKGGIYYLNRLFCPIFQISYRTRGGYNYIIKTSTFEQMLKKHWAATDLMTYNSQKYEKRLLVDGNANR